MSVGTVKKQPLRMCLGCQEMKNKKELVRVIRTPENEYVLDMTGKKNGRGAYVCPNKECIRKVVKSRGLDRAFKCQVPDSAYEQLLKEAEQVE